MKRLPIVRHIRAMILNYKLNKYMDSMKGVFVCANPTDVQYIKDVWGGKA